MSVFGRPREQEAGTSFLRSTTPDSGYADMSQSSYKAVCNTPRKLRKERTEHPTYKRSFASPHPWTSAEQREYSETNALISSAAEMSANRRRIAEKRKREWMGRSLTSIRNIFWGVKEGEPTSKRWQRRRRRERRWPASRRNTQQHSSSFTEVSLMGGRHGRWFKLFHIKSESTGGMAVRSKVQPLFGLRRVDQHLICFKH